MKKFDSALYIFLRTAVGVLLFAMMAVIFSQVVARYVFHRSLSWSEEVGRYLFVWIAFLGFAAAFKAGAHIALDFLLKQLSSVPFRVLSAVNGLLTIALSVTILVSGMKLFQLGMRQKSPALDLPMHWVYAVVPLSGLLLLYFSIRALTAPEPEPVREEEH